MYVSLLQALTSGLAYFRIRVPRPFTRVPRSARVGGRAARTYRARMWALGAAAAAAGDYDPSKHYVHTYVGNNALQFNGGEYVRVPHDVVMNAPLMKSSPLSLSLSLSISLLAARTMLHRPDLGSGTRSAKAQRFQGVFLVM